MNTRNVIVKIAYGTIAALVIVLVSLLIYQQHLIKQMANSETPATSAPVESTQNLYEDSSKSAAASTKTGQEKAGGDVDELRYQLEATEEELDMAREDLSNEFDKQAEQTKNMVELQRNMLKNPAMKKLMRNNMKSTVDLQYGDLFAMLELPEEKAEALKELLTDQMMEMVEVNLQILDQSSSDEDKKEIGTQLAEQNAEYDSQLVDLLGAEKFEIYETYKERSSERQSVATYTSALGTADALTETQEQELIEAMYEARKAVEAEYGYDSTDIAQNIANVGMDTDSALDQEVERMNSTFERYIESAQGILSESQAAQFETQMKEQQEMVTMSINLARQLYGGSTASE